MKRDLVDIIRCPSCGGEFKLEVCIENFEIEEGELICKSCSNKYKISAGIPILLDKLDNMELKRKEIEGWKKRREMKKTPIKHEVESSRSKVINIQSDKGNDNTPNAFLLSLPYTDTTKLPNWVNEAEITYWKKVSNCFDIWKGSIVR